MNGYLVAIIKTIDAMGKTSILRIKYAKADLKRKINVLGKPQVNKKQKSKIKSYWEKFGIIPNVSFIYLYNQLYNNESEFDASFIPDDLFYCFIDPYYNRAEATKYMDDKNFYDLYFPDISKPMTLVRKINGFLLDGSFKAGKTNDLIELCKSKGEVIVKKSVDSEGGKGVQIINTIQDDTTLKNIIEKEDNIVIQEIIRQHPKLNAIHDGSVNTIRIMSLLYEGEVVILSTILRMGRGKSRVDNASSGGMFCGIDEKGCLKKFAFDMDGHKYDKHPDGVVFDNYYIPGIEECKSIIKDKAVLLARFSKMTSWDFAINENGHPILIEVNMAYGQLDFHQMTNGPIFKELTPTIIRQVFANSTKKKLYNAIKIR